MKKEKIKEYKKELVQVFMRAASDRDIMAEFLLDIMTPAEYDEAAIRWQIVKRLHRDEKHREIAGELGIGISTVNRGSRELRNKKGGFAQLLSRLGL